MNNKLGIVHITPLRAIIVLACIAVVVTAWTAGHWLVLTVAVAVLILALWAQGSMSFSLERRGRGQDE